MTEHTFDPCGPNYVARPIITDTAEGREHENAWTTARRDRHDGR